MNDVYVFRAVPYQQDSRTVRYKNLLKGNVIFNCWEDYYSNSSGLESIKLGKKRFSKFLVYPLYLIYLLMYSLFKVKKGSISICMDLDTFIPVYFGSKLVGNKVILDIVDPISQTRFSKFKFNKIFDFIELFIIKYRGDVILPLENRVQFYLDRLNLKWDIPIDNYIILENVPEISTINSTGVFFDSKIENNSEDVKRIGYFGTLDSSRGLLELIEFVKKFPSYELYLSGRGSFVDVIISESENFKNIKFLGPYHPNDISELYRKVDFIWAFYSSDVYLHHYAAPNKFYEHLAFKTPIICNECIPQSHLVRQYSSGIVISNILNENCMSDLDLQIRNFNYNDFSFSIWDDKYSNYSNTLRAYNEKYDIFK